MRADHHHFVDICFLPANPTGLYLGHIPIVMRGNGIFKDVKDKNSPVALKRKGRSDKLLNRRNECLIERYYYYGEYTDKRFELVIQQLSDEFFLSQNRITDIVEANRETLNQLKKEKPPLAYFQNKWGFLKW